jgi:ferric-dicitrate binding protein FerR (iron transport regulator)
MRCEEFLNQLNARADSELPAEEAAALDAHLAECAECLADSEQLASINAELRRAFVPRREAAARMAERVAVAIGASTANVPPALPIARPQRIAWKHVLAGLAAGFLLAVTLFRPWQPRSVERDSLPSFDPIARLAVASGPVEVLPASQLEVFTCPPGGSIERDSTVRTGPSARCELSLDDGNALRLDCNTEVTLHGSEVIEVNRGRLYSCSPPDRKGSEIQSGGGTILPSEAAQFAVDCEPQAVRLVVVDGAVNVQTEHDSKELGPGERVRIVQGKLEDDLEPRDALLETAWVNSVLALGSSQHPELVERVNQLLANVGAAKLSLLYEDELRRLGDAGVPPLLAYLDSTRESADAAQRATAARIVADVAHARRIADLIALLTDANADVRFHAARGLERLTGRDQGCKPQTWQSEPWAACESAHKMWLDWWAENRDRYPATASEIPERASPPD